MSALHTRDEDCTVVDGSCVECGVAHSDSDCRSCDGIAFHRAWCPESDATMWAGDQRRAAPMFIVLATPGGAL